jgi:hypothetical protein
MHLATWRNLPAPYSVLADQPSRPGVWTPVSQADCAVAGIDAGWGGGPHPAREYQPSTGTAKGSKILWPSPSARSRPRVHAASARPKHLGSPADQALDRSRSRAVIGAYQVKPTMWETTRIGAIMNRTNWCSACGGLMPALGCTCDGKAHTCTPAICTVCMGSGVPVACLSDGDRRSIAVTRRHVLAAPPPAAGQVRKTGERSLQAGGPVVRAPLRLSDRQVSPLKRAN